MPSPQLKQSEIDWPISFTEKNREHDCPTARRIDRRNMDRRARIRTPGNIHLTSRGCLLSELGLGANVMLGSGLTLYAEASSRTTTHDFGDSYALKANAGLRMAF